MYLFIWLVLTYILCDKIVIYTLLNSVTHSSELANLRLVVGTLIYVANWSEIQVGLEIPKQVCEVRAVLLESVLTL